MENIDIKEDDETEEQKEYILDDNNVQKILTFFDHETAIACEISKDEKYLFVLTKVG